ncbi:MAG: hypothetical protein P3X24_005260 [bacterium]|nr:hypothetical protein [bacterium]
MTTTTAPKPTRKRRKPPAQPTPTPNTLHDIHAIAPETIPAPEVPLPIQFHDAAVWLPNDASVL